ncbi:UDP-N-acetylmuramoyl-tripeptide--D-alanyl-D-alanine ligase [bacterium]|nr:UDP-N-acetylmuramoyl-tripeptide--D-alanyl-D-alanine ligase [bacterium]
MFSWITLENLASWTLGTWRGQPPPALPVKSFSTDSRTIKSGEVFIALKGPNFDGHAYVAQVAKQGALAAIVQEACDVDIPQLVVPNTQGALVALGENIREAFKGPVLAITGSAGKSSTKEMVADLVGDKAVRSPKSFNNILGVPRTIFLVQDGTQALVLEVGMNAPGEIAEICQHFKPTMGLITNIGEAHMGKLGGQEGIFRAKKELFEWLSRTAAPAVAVNLDDPFVVRAYEECFKGPHAAVTYSAKGASADVRVLSAGMDPSTGGLTVELDIRGNRGTVRLGLFGLHQAQNIAASSAAALLLGLKPLDILARLPQLKSTAQRGEFIPLPEDRTLIDESYNSNPSALEASLLSMAQLDPQRRRVLVLGEMRELGDYSAAQHARIGHSLVKLYLQKKFPFLLIGVGSGFLPFLSAVEKELPGAPCLAVPDAEVAVERLRSLLLPGDIVLVKGSRGIQLERVVEFLKT